MGKVFKQLLIYLLVAIIAIGGTWYYLRGKHTAEDRQYQSKIDTLNRQKNAYADIIDSLAVDTARLGDVSRNLKDSIKIEIAKRDSIDQESEQEKKEIDSMPLDSVAKFISDYLGDGDYKLVQVDSNIYVAFSGTLTRRMGKSIVEVKKLKYKELSYIRELNKKDSLIGNLSLQSMKRDSMVDSYRNQLSLEEGKGELKDARMKFLEKRVKRFKLIGAGGVIIGIVIAIL